MLHLDLSQLLRQRRRKIYFDGYLPHRKWATRKMRLVQQTLLMEKLSRWSKPVQAPRVDYLASINYRDQVSALRCYNQQSSWPKPPFLVPAVIDSLRDSPTWRSLVQIVPGEADAYCAEDVKKNGGTVITSDSDLLVQDLGPSGGVAFVNDVKVSKQHELKIRMHWLSDLEERLNINDSGGLLRLAYEFSQSSYRFDHALFLAQNPQFPGASSPVATLSSEKYLEFCDETLPQQYIPESHPLVPILSSLDPRISELVIQSLNIEVMVPTVDRPQVERGPRGPEEISMWLPIMIGDHNRKSAWSMSEPIRQLAYGAAQPDGAGRRESLIEYRTLVSDYGGRRMNIPDAATLEMLCMHWSGILELDAVRNSQHPWLTLAIYQDIAWSLSLDERPVSVGLIHECRLQEKLQGKEKLLFSWQMIHFNAQVQAAYYSLRMLKQILDVMARLSPDNFGNLTNWGVLRDHLSKLPPITAWPSVEEMPGLLAAFNAEGGIAAASRMLGVPKSQLRPPPYEKKLAKRTAKDPARISSTNSFAALEREAEAS